MSLINDALRRAKQAHQETPPSPPPDAHFRPVDPPTQATRQTVGLLMPALLAAVALLGLLLFWELSHKNGTPASDSNGPITVAAKTPAAADQPSPSVSAAAAADTSAGGNTAMISKPAFETNAETRTAAATLASTNSSISDQGDTNHAGTEPAVPAVAPLKLQGIIYNPSRPSALINGRVIFLGDRVREYRVMAIRRDEVVLAEAGRTNVLSLEP